MNTPAGRQMIAGAGVDAYTDLNDDSTLAYTQTNSAGRYVLCGLPGKITDVYVGKVGFSGNSLLGPFVKDGDLFMDFEIKPLSDRASGTVSQARRIHR